MNIFNEDNNINKKANKFHLKENQSTLWSRIFKNEDNQFYSEIIIKGFIWVLMFVVSLVALFIVFKEGYGNNKEVIVLNSKNTVYTDNFPVTNSDNFEYSSKEKNNSVITNKSNPKDKTLPLKNSKLEKNTSQNTEVSSNNFKSMDLSNDLSSNEDSNYTDTIDNLIRDTIGQNLNKPDNLSSNTNKKVATNDNVAKKASSSTVVTVNNKVWLVTVFSGKEEIKARSKWKEIYNSNPNLFVNKSPYFIKTNIEGKGIYYRVSLGNISTNKSLPYFATSKEAATYCSYLKNHNVSCFVIEADKSLLKSLINK